MIDMSSAGLRLSFWRDSSGCFEHTHREGLGPLPSAIPI
jgi:hypothetical protein